MAVIGDSDMISYMKLLPATMRDRSTTLLLSSTPPSKKAARREMIHSRRAAFCDYYGLFLFRAFFGKSAKREFFRFVIIEYIID